jgi:transcriptional regulator with XRE-family HTH domain
VEIGSRVRTLRDALKLTQDELARETGVTAQHISRIEGGLNVPSLDLLVKLSRALGVSADYLLTREETPAFDVKGAIRGTAGLSAKSKRLLIELVGELRGE